jgi:Family of unknown function (DUF6011)
MVRTPVPQEFGGEAKATPKSWRDEPPTDKQRSFVARLRRERELDESGQDWLTAEMAKPDLTKGRVHDIIDHLLALPVKPKASVKPEEPNAPRVEPGRYALREPTDTLNPIRFYKIDDGKDLRSRGGQDWTGFQFVERYASDETFPIKGKDRYRVLEAIAADPLAAAQLYGQEARRCTVCNRKLTRRLSRELGIGPVCAVKVEWMTPDYIDSITQSLIAQGLDPKETIKEDA